MLQDLYHGVESGIIDTACLCIPKIINLTTPPNPGADSSITNGTCVYLHLTSSQGPNTGSVSPITGMPIITSNGLAYGGQAVAVGTSVLPKIILEGFIDTPAVVTDDNYYVPSIIDSDGIRYTYAEIIAMMIEGRANADSTNGWQRADPFFYRDPYGRIFVFPRILDFQAQYVEGIPQRTQFSMTLRV